MGCKSNDVANIVRYSTSTRGTCYKYCNRYVKQYSETIFTAVKYLNTERHCSKRYNANDVPGSVT